MIKAGCTRSQTGVFIMLNSMPVYWKSNKQPVTALSSAEAEVYAMMEAVKESRLRMWVAEEAGIEVSYPLTLMVDRGPIAKDRVASKTCYYLLTLASRPPTVYRRRNVATVL